MGFHYEMLLRAFGPVHSWRAWAFERFNYTLQNIKTNSKFGKLCLLCSFSTVECPTVAGEMEMTFMNDACRAANLSAVLFSDRLPDDMKALLPAFQKAFRSDIRGTRLNDMLAFGDSSRLKVTYASTGRGKLAEQNARYRDNISALTGMHYSGTVLILWRT